MSGAAYVDSNNIRREVKRNPSGKYKACYKLSDGERWYSCPFMRWMDSQAEAQKALDVMAQKKGWELA